MNDTAATLLSACSASDHTFDEMKKAICAKSFQENRLAEEVKNKLVFAAKIMHNCLGYKEENNDIEEKEISSINRILLCFVPKDPKEILNGHFLNSFLTLYDTVTSFLVSKLPYSSAQLVDLEKASILILEKAVLPAFESNNTDIGNFATESFLNTLGKYAAGLPIVREKGDKVEFPIISEIIKFSDSLTEFSDPLRHKQLVNVHAASTFGKFSYVIGERDNTTIKKQTKCIQEISAVFLERHTIDKNDLDLYRAYLSGLSPEAGSSRKKCLRFSFKRICNPVFIGNTVTSTRTTHENIPLVSNMTFNPSTSTRTISSFSINPVTASPLSIVDTSATYSSVTSNTTESINLTSNQTIIPYETTTASSFTDRALYAGLTSGLTAGFVTAVKDEALYKACTVLEVLENIAERKNFSRSLINSIKMTFLLLNAISSTLIYHFMMEITRILFEEDEPSTNQRILSISIYFFLEGFSRIPNFFTEKHKLKEIIGYLKYFLVSLSVFNFLQTTEKEKEALIYASSVAGGILGKSVTNLTIKGVKRLKFFPCKNEDKTSEIELGNRKYASNTALFSSDTGNNDLATLNFDKKREITSFLTEDEKYSLQKKWATLVSSVLAYEKINGSSKENTKKENIKEVQGDLNLIKMQLEYGKGNKSSLIKYDESIKIVIGLLSELNGQITSLSPPGDTIKKNLDSLKIEIKSIEKAVSNRILAKEKEVYVRVLTKVKEEGIRSCQKNTTLSK
ncbi:MAG: hypothetical protein V4700_01630 [Pseudomonadota bacterium]